MKIHLPLAFALFSAPSVSSFQNRHHRLHIRMSTMQRKSTAEDIETVTKETLLAARDEIDELLREKACGMFNCCVTLSH